MIPITKPTLPPFEHLRERYEDVFQTGMLTNHKYVQAFETKIVEKTGVKHAIAISSCTAGMMLAMKAYKLQGEAILPSFTFCATGHAVLWNGLKPVFADIEAKHYCLNPEQVNDAITPKTAAILAVHMFGHPADVAALQEIAADHRLKLIFDSAHAFGSKVGSQYVGNFGDAESFSCSPTKLMTTGEGGILTTSDAWLARHIRVGRGYGDPGDYNCIMPGLNARMSEFHAALGISSLDMLEQNVEARNRLVEVYKRELRSIPGISFQEIAPNVRTTFKDFSLYIDPLTFGMTRDRLCDELLKRGIQSKKYFYPPVHLQDAYRQYRDEFHAKLPVTMDVTTNALSLPLYSHMQESEILHVVQQVREVQQHG